jgi:hypothetical protein
MNMVFPGEECETVSKTQYHRRWTHTELLRSITYRLITPPSSNLVTS